MKKRKKIFGLLFLVLIMTISLFPSTSSATWGWGSWKNTGLGNCEVRVWTDANTYTKNATTIDYKAEQRGNCGKLYYTSSIALYGQIPIWYVGISPYQTGYFNYSTPIKQFRLSSLRQTGVDAVVRVELYADAAKTRFIGTSYKEITIHKR